jgi:DNA gyrase/topoisomerase IV subunit A
MSRNLSISDQINQQYRTYALYVLQSRGIPNFYDALTPVQRLILENSPTKYNKTIGLVGEVIKTGLYHHGDSSLSGAISKLARPFGCSFGVLEGDGFFGSPVNPSPSAPRYTSVRVNSKIKDFLFKNYDLNEKNEEGGHDWLHVEVPVGLLTHVIGIAVGYRSNILPRKLEDIIEYLEGSTKLLKPYFKDFSGKITKYKNEDNTWLFESGFDVDERKKLIHIYDLPPVMRYDSFINKLDSRLENSGVEYRIENRSQSKCDLIVSLRGVDNQKFKEIVESISRLCKIIVKEDVIFIKDGGVLEFSSVKEYLDHFKGHLEYVKLKRLMKDLSNHSRDLEFLEAKLKFLNFMILKKRTNDEIIQFLSQFQNWISQRLQKIEIIRLSTDHIKQTEIDIKEVKSKIQETKKKVKDQEKIHKEVIKKIQTLGKIKSFKPATNLFEPDQIDGIEIYQIPEDEDTETISDNEMEEDEI